MAAPYKVLQVIARLNVGGAALHVMMLAAHLRPPDNTTFDSRIVCGVVGADEADMGYVAKEHAVPVLVIPHLGREISVRSDLLTLWKLYRLFRHERPTIIHTHTAKAGFVGRVAARLAGVPIVVHTFHGHVFHGYFGTRKTRLFLVLERLCARLADRIIAPSAELKRQLVEDYHICPASKIEVIEVGLDLAPLAGLRRSTGDFRAAHRIPSDAPLVGIIGRLVPIKHHDLFLAAASKVHERRQTVHFVLVGDGERRAELEAMAHNLGIEECTRFAGWVTDVKPIYAALDAVVLSSRNEGIPISIIEAMAAQVPVVSTRVGGVPDLILDPTYGAVVPPDDADAMASAILRALDRTGFDLTAAQQHVLTRYDMGRIAQVTETLYRTLIEKKPRPSR